MSDNEPPDETHTNAQNCISFVTKNNKLTERLARVLYDLQNSDPLNDCLFTFTKLIKQEELEKIKIFLQTLHALDDSDCEDISNGYVNTNTAKKVIALVDVLAKKGPHGYWFIVHALRAKHPDFFNDKHGDIKCCICGEVERVQLPVVPSTKRELIVEDMMKEVKKMTQRFKKVEKNFKIVVLSLQNFKDEIKDVMSNESISYGSYCHAQLSMIKKAKNKYQKFKDSLLKKDVVIAMADTVGDDDTTVQKGNSCDCNCEDCENEEQQQQNSPLLNEDNRVRTKCSRVSLTPVKRFLKTSYAIKNIAKVVILIGAAVCIEWVFSYAIAHGKEG